MNIARVRPAQASLNNARNLPPFGALDANPPGTAVQVLVRWGDSVLQISTLTPKHGAFFLGKSLKDEDCSFEVGPDILAESRWQLVQLSAEVARVEIPSAALATLFLFDTKDPDALPRTSLATGNLELSLGACLVVELGTLVFEITHHDAESPWNRQLAGGELQPLVTYFSASFVSVAALLASSAFFMPPLGLNADEHVDGERLYLMQQYLEASAERERVEEPTPAVAEDGPAGGRDGARAAGAEGAAGKPTAAKTGGKLAVKGPADNARPELSVRELAVNFGMIGLVSGGVLSESINVPWQRDAALGSDPIDAQGALFGEELQDSLGAGGLGILGLSEGGGSQYQGIGLSEVGTIGTRGNCTGEDCLGEGGKFGRSLGRGQRTHTPQGPRIRASSVSVSGHLPKETIQRIVRLNFGRFRSCYEQGLAQNPNLAGRVQVRFLIDHTGKVSTAANGGSDLPDSNVVSCVTRTFYGLSFPKPERGTINVTYPISFSPE
jgi:hypothetical protein